jgi:hypothetical protein
MIEIVFPAISIPNFVSNVQSNTLQILMELVLPVWAIVIIATRQALELVIKICAVWDTHG